jgi:hypothetical protein
MSGPLVPGAGLVLRKTRIHSSIFFELVFVDEAVDLDGAEKVADAFAGAALGNFLAQLDVIAKSDLRGIDSHGVFVLSRYRSRSLQAVEKGSPASLDSSASLKLVFVFRDRARWDFTFTFHGHDHDKTAPRIRDLFAQPGIKLFQHYA